MTVVDVHDHAAPRTVAGALLLGRLLLLRVGRRRRIPTPAAAVG